MMTFANAWICQAGLFGVDMSAGFSLNGLPLHIDLISGECRHVV